MSVNINNLNDELVAALPAVVGCAVTVNSPGVASGTLVSLRLWLQKSVSLEWVGVDFASTPSAPNQTTAATTVNNHTGIPTLKQKLEAAGLVPAALACKFTKDYKTANSTFTTAYTLAQRNAINALIDGADVFIESVVKS